MAKILGCSVRMSSKLSADKCTTSPESPSQLPERARRREQRERAAQAEGAGEAWSGEVFTRRRGRRAAGRSPGRPACACGSRSRLRSASAHIAGERSSAGAAGWLEGWGLAGRAGPTGRALALVIRGLAVGEHLDGREARHVEPADAASGRETAAAPSSAARAQRRRVGAGRRRWGALLRRLRLGRGVHLRDLDLVLLQRRRGSVVLRSQRLAVPAPATASGGQGVRRRGLRERRGAGPRTTARRTPPGSGGARRRVSCRRKTPRRSGKRWHAPSCARAA